MLFDDTSVAKRISRAGLFMPMKNQPDPNTYSLLEAAVDISMTVQWAIENGKWTAPEDSREMVSRIIELAHEFEEIHGGRLLDGEYLETIEHFTLQKLDIL